MVETSLGVVSACLPTLRPLAGVYSVNRIISSLRSFGSRQDLMQSAGLSIGNKHLESRRGVENTKTDLSPKSYIMLGRNKPGFPDDTNKFTTEGVQMDELKKPAEGAMAEEVVSLGREEL